MKNTIDKKYSLNRQIKQRKLKPWIYKQNILISLHVLIDMRLKLKIKLEPRKQ